MHGICFFSHQGSTTSHSQVMWYTAISSTPTCTWCITWIILGAMESMIRKDGLKMAIISSIELSSFRPATSVSLPALPLRILHSRSILPIHAMEVVRSSGLLALRAPKKPKFKLNSSNKEQDFTIVWLEHPLGTD